VRVDKTLNNGSRSGKGICDEGKMYKILNRFSDPVFFFFVIVAVLRQWSLNSQPRDCEDAFLRSESLCQP
jgi:hypothetical protein